MDKEISKKSLKEKTNDLKRKAKSAINDYKKFAIKGNAIELAIGIVIGSAFTNIVNSIVSSVITPLISIFTNKVDISSLFISLDGKKYESIEAAKEAGAAIITYGNLINSIINFLILSIVLFIMLKYITSIKNKLEKLDKNANEEADKVKKATTKKCPYCISEIDINATRCPHCTSIIEEPEIETEEEKLSEEMQKQK